MKLLSRDLGVDLGTANVLVYAGGKGVVLREPSVVAVDKNTGKILQVGSAARNMMGRTPGNVVAMRPLQNGVISDYEMTQRMLTLFFRKAVPHAVLKPRVIVSVPSSITEVEERAVINAAMEAGARGKFIPASLNKDGSLGRYSSTLDREGLQTVLDYVKRVVATMGEALLEGRVEAAPHLKNRSACRYCPYSPVCGKEFTAKDVELDKTTPQQALEKMRETLEKGGNPRG